MAVHCRKSNALTGHSIYLGCDSLASQCFNRVGKTAVQSSAIRKHVASAADVLSIGEAWAMAAVVRNPGADAKLLLDRGSVVDVDGVRNSLSSVSLIPMPD